MINKVILVGNLGRDPEVKTIGSGDKVASFSVATSESYKDKNGDWQSKTEWHNIVVWKYLAEKAERSLKKGSLVYVEGKVTTRKWEDKEGNTRYTTEIVGRVLQSLERRDNDSQQTQQSAPTPQVGPGEDDLPF